MEALEGEAIPYMLTGSHASSLLGEPRATHDVDLVVAIEGDAQRVRRLLAHFPAPRFYCDMDVAASDARRGAMFGVIDSSSGEKLDFWPLGADSFSQASFARRYRESVGSANEAWDLWVIAPEDLILAKLHWGKLAGGSEKQHNDALRVLEVQQERLDMAYLDRWADWLGVHPQWECIRREARPLG